MSVRLTLVASVPAVASTAHGCRSTSLRIRAASIANGSLIVSSFPPRSVTLSCSALSRSAGCTFVPCRCRRRSSRPTAHVPSSVHAASTLRKAGPYCRPTSASAAYKAVTSVLTPHRGCTSASCADCHMPASAASIWPLQCTGESPATSLRTSKLPSWSRAHSTHAASSTSSGDRKCTKRRATPSEDGETAAKAARAISR